MSEGQTALIQPYAHRFGHHSSFTDALSRALASRSRVVSIITSLPPLNPLRHETVVLTDRHPGMGSLLRWLERKEALRLRIGNKLATLFCALSALRQSPEVLHFIDGSYSIVALVALFSDARSLYHVWGHPPYGYKRSGVGFRLLARAVKKGKVTVVCETSALREEWGVAVGHGGVVAIPYGIEIAESTDRKTARRRLEIKGSEVLLLVFGTHREDKDFETLLLALQSARLPSMVAFVGKTVSGVHPSSALQRYDKVRAIVRDQFVDDDEMGRWFTACDLVVLPYAAGYDKGSGVLVEALRFGRPVLATDTGSLREFVLTYGTGFLYRPGDHKDLQRALEGFTQLDEAALAELQKRISAAAWIHDWNQVAISYLDLYDRLSA